MVGVEARCAKLGRHDKVRRRCDDASGGAVQADAALSAYIQTNPIADAFFSLLARARTITL
jgi:hypothetical protein